MSVWLIGAGEMARNYAKVLIALKVSFDVVGNSAATAAKFYDATGVAVETGGVGKLLKIKKSPDVAIVAVSVEELCKTVIQLIVAGTKRILVEKPAALSFSEIQRIFDLSVNYRSEVYIGYNRRFYASVERLKEFVDEDGGVLSAHFEFTEKSHIISALQKAPSVHQRWMLANSTHVVDLVFHLIGRPKRWANWSSGGLDWHPSAARFVGAGLTERGALFSYIADWDAPGGWGVELATKNYRLILKPLETLQLIKVSSDKSESVLLVGDLDNRYKPGLYSQTEAFLFRPDDPRLCHINEHLLNFPFYEQMAGYSD